MAEAGRVYDADYDKKWDECIDITMRRAVYSSLAGLVTGLLLFRSPASRLSTTTFGAGLGLGSAYTDCSRMLSSFSDWPKPAKPSQN